MRESRLDNLPENVQKAIYHVFSQANTRDKVIFLSRLEYGNDLSYKDLSNMVGVTFQRIQQLYDGLIEQVKHSSYLMSGVYSSGIMYNG